MKYYVIYSSNGALQTASGKITEWENINQAIAKYHDVCKSLWNTAEVTDAFVQIIDSQLNQYGNYKESIHKESQE